MVHHSHADPDGPRPVVVALLQLSGERDVMVHSSSIPPSDGVIFSTPSSP